MGLSNDERGWVMTGMSGLACIFGASFICIDVVVRQFPGKRNFRIQDSDAFLSVSLSLSFGVMLFSAIYSMLPSSKRSLEEGGSSPRQAAWIMIGCFMAGAVGIQFLSQLFHHLIPHSVVECEHDHQVEDDHKEGNGSSEVQNDSTDGQDACQNSGYAHHPSHDDGSDCRQGGSHGHRSSRQDLHRHGPASGINQLPGSGSPTDLRDFRQSRSETNRSKSHPPRIDSDTRAASPGLAPDANLIRPSFPQRITAGISKITSGRDPSCECDGPCYGFSEVCGTECFRSITSRALVPPITVAEGSTSESTPLLQHVRKERSFTRPHSRQARSIERGPSRAYNERDDMHQALSEHPIHAHGAPKSHRDNHSEVAQSEYHHHHVPTNAFLSIGLQTSIAIALHKLPEGFITYATNHANPKLGVSVFLALFIHNITEGFALALPLYLAINSRMKAMLASFVLGGLSQPLGAGVAALWFKIAGETRFAPSETAYGVMFAITAGIMANVALQLFSESLELTHSKHLCMIGALAGMLILGASSALTAS